MIIDQIDELVLRALRDDVASEVESRKDEWPAFAATVLREIESDEQPEQKRSARSVIANDCIKKGRRHVAD